jgi:glutathionylspermidine synthase
MTFEFEIGTSLDPRHYSELVERSAQDCFKWTLAAGDYPVLAPFPILLKRKDWITLVELAQALDQEAQVAERELLERPELHEYLGIPELTTACLARSAWSSAPRYTRFDFHITQDGLRITESNCDVAGGLLEASGVTSIYCDLAGRPQQPDPAGAFAYAFRQAFGEGARIGLGHLSSYTEDRQVVLYLARRLTEHGLVPHLMEPSQLRPGLRAMTPHGLVDLDALYRFFPGDWLEQLPRETGWPELFQSQRVSNPLTSLLVQSKRFPLIWPKLNASLPTWKRLLPPTVPPETLENGFDNWVVKPAMGHEGADIIMPSAAGSSVRDGRCSTVWREPHRWVAQRKFEMVAIPTPIGARFICIGVFVVNGQAVGSYARLGPHPMLDDKTQEAVVLVNEHD